MDYKSVLAKKLELETLPYSDIQKLVKKFGVPTNMPNNDILWHIAIVMHTGNKAMLPSGDLQIDCDYIDWFVDILGTTDLLEAVLENETDTAYPVVNIYAPEEGDKELAAAARKCLSRKECAEDIESGLYFKRAHWYLIKNNKVLDSYRLNYQIKGTAHFCQTFALIILLGLDDEMLKSGEYAFNIKQVINFWKYIFGKYPELLDYFINEIKTSDYTIKENRDLVLPGKTVKFSKITKKDLMQYMDLIADNAEKFINCKEG